ncbi:MAG: hypothetical protein ACO1SV_13820 [Fimbriimonas sp.]
MRTPCGELVELSSLPPILRECARRDARDGSDHAPTALDAFESLGLALMASDRDIAEEEVSLIHTVMGAWRQDIDGHSEA